MECNFYVFNIVIIVQSTGVTKRTIYLNLRSPLFPLVIATSGNSNVGKEFAKRENIKVLQIKLYNMHCK